MKEIDFNAFVVYKVYDNGCVVVNHVVKGNDFNSYREVIKTIYEKWGRKRDNVTDIILLTLPCNKPYDIENPIFRASTIGTDKEYDRNRFQTDYYGGY